MNQILIEYDPFTMESRVFVVQDDKISEGRVSSSLDTLATNILAQTYAYGIYNVKVRAPLGIFTKVRQDIEDAEKNKYGLNKITLENVR